MRLRLIVLAALSVLVAGCLLLPGKFDSALDIRRDGTFHFHYAGEIVYLPLTEAARAKMKAGHAGSDGADGVPHGTPQGTPTVINGLDLGDPKAAAMFADMLRREAGWHKVESRGNGVFDVDYDISGRLDHDFTFPTIEHTPLMVPFVAVTRRADGSVHIEAPGFAPGLGNLGTMGAMEGSLGAALGGMTVSPQGKGTRDAQNPLSGVPPMDGTFVVTTDDTILTNNTDDGPVVAAPGSQRLLWKIGAGHAAAPVALIRP